MRIKHEDPIGSVRTPFPQHQVTHVGTGSDRERWHQDAGRFFAYEAVGNLPRSGITTLGAVILPAACHVCTLRIVWVTQINDVVDVDFIGADRERRKPMWEAVRLLSDHAFRRTGEIERGCSDTVKATAIDLCAIE